MSIKVEAETNNVTVSTEINNVEVNAEISNITVDVETSNIIVTDNQPVVKVQSVGAQGKPGPPAVRDWGYYANNVEYTGTDTTIAAGTVLECTLGTNTIYRFINGTNNANGYPIEDSFYSDFDGTNLTNLLATRGE